MTPERRAPRRVVQTHPDGSPCFCAGRVLPDKRFVPGPRCPTSRERNCVCGVPGRDPEACDFHRTRTAAGGAK